MAAKHLGDRRATVKMNNVDLFAWLTQTLERIANRWPISSVEQSFPELQGLTNLSYALTTCQRQRELLTLGRCPLPYSVRQPVVLRGWRM